MGEAKAGKHRPKVGSWIPARQSGAGFGVIGVIGKKLLGRLGGWDNPGREES